MSAASAVTTRALRRQETSSDESSLEFADLLRVDVTSQLNTTLQGELGQFFTGASTAQFMSGMFVVDAPSLHLLDAGAGIGSLIAAFVTEICGRPCRPQSLQVTAYETDGELLPHLQDTLTACQRQCESVGIHFQSYVRHEDFIAAGVDLLQDGMFGSGAQFDCAILNPPYRKLRTDSDWRRSLSTIGIETTNLYSAFLWLAIRLLHPGGELVAITPRSFCNGPYFKPFRVALNDSMQFRRIHLFESRVEAFRDNNVLQENIIFHAVKNTGLSEREAPVVISTSLGPDSDDGATQRTVARSQIIRPGDPDVFINLVADDWGQQIANRMRELSASLKDIGISVSTGRVVDFRAKDHLRMSPVADPGEITVPLIYPLHLNNGGICWPKDGSRKPNALAVTDDTLGALNTAGFYVLVKRFTSKEQPRRIVAAIYDPGQVTQNGLPAPRVAFENHLNYFHENGTGLSQELAAGLAAFLNSTLVDTYFRQFNGHTQVNATDLRSLKYPPRAALETLGRRLYDSYTDATPTQAELDALVTQELLPMADGDNVTDPLKSKTRIDEALQILKALKLERQQQNERSALTLLALLDLSPEKEWDQATNPLCGITPMMDFFREHYGKNYAPNTRETVRRQSVHQFMQAGLIVANPDDPERPVNSAKNVYQVTPEALELVRTFGTPEWEQSLGGFIALQDAIRARALRERSFHRIPVVMPDGQSFSLSPGGQNLLIKEIVEKFCPRYTPGGKVLYLGDADEKWASYDATSLATLGIEVNEHGKMPDVVVHFTDKNWLVLVEAVTSHGPVDLKRHVELKQLFAGSTAGLVFVTAFMDRAGMGKYLRDIAWETEVWVADAPDHLIHFDGERFLGPYESS